jgi:hypothetical protein
MPIADSLEVGHRRAAARLRRELEPVLAGGVELRGRLGTNGAEERHRAAAAPRGLDADVDVGQMLGGDLDGAAAELVQHRGEPDHLVVLGAAARHRAAVAAEVRRRLRGREAQRAGAHALAQQLLHARDFLLRRGALGGRVVEDVIAQRRVAEERADVEHGLHRRDRFEVLRERLPVPGDATAQGGQAHALDALEHAHDAVAPLRLARGEREAAVAHHDARHAVPA